MSQELDGAVAAEVSADQEVTPSDAKGDAPVEKVIPPSHPEWFMKDKYTSIEEQAKAQYNMQKMMGKNWGAPKDDYVLEGVALDPMLEHIKPTLKEMGISQEGFKTLVNSYSDATVKYAQELQNQVQKEMTKEDALAVQAVDKWIDNSFADEDKEVIKSWIVSPNDFKILNKLRSMVPNMTNVPSSITGSAVHFESSDQVHNEKVKYKKEVASGLRVKDKNFEDSLQQRWRDAYTRENIKKK